MQIASDAKTHIAINADGTVPQGSLIDGKPFLHILPRLWLPYPELDVNREMDIWLEKISIPALGIDVGGVEFKPSRPFPNWNYVIFGKGRKMGFYIPLDTSLPNELVIHYYYVLSGNFRTELSGFCMEIQHAQTLHVQRSAVGIDCYSTERLTPVFICGKEFVQVFKETHGEAVKEYGHPAVEDSADSDYCGDEWYLTTEESLAPLSNRFVLSEYFATHEPHHSKKQCIKLTKYNDTHRQNASHEIPIAVFLDAVRAAGAIEINDKELPEKHSALAKLCNWWNNNESVRAELRQAQTCEIWVRFRNADEYQSLNLEVPTIAISDLNTNIVQCSARLGDHFLIIFLQGYDALVEHRGGTDHFLVNGKCFETVGVSKDEVAPGWATLRGLAVLPTAYPKIYQHYEQTMEIDA